MMYRSLCRHWHRCYSYVDANDPIHSSSHDPMRIRLINQVAVWIAAEHRKRNGLIAQLDLTSFLTPPQPARKPSTVIFAQPPTDQYRPLKVRKRHGIRKRHGNRLPNGQDKSNEIRTLEQYHWVIPRRAIFGKFLDLAARDSSNISLTTHVTWVELYCYLAEPFSRPTNTM